MQPLHTPLLHRGSSRNATSCWLCCSGCACASNHRGRVSRSCARRRWRRSRVGRLARSGSRVSSRSGTHGSVLTKPRPLYHIVPTCQYPIARTPHLAVLRLLPPPRPPMRRPRSIGRLPMPSAHRRLASIASPGALSSTRSGFHLRIALALEPMQASQRSMAPMGSFTSRQQHRRGAPRGSTSVPYPISSSSPLTQRSCNALASGKSQSDLNKSVLYPLVHSHSLFLHTPVLCPHPL